MPFEYICIWLALGAEVIALIMICIAMPFLLYRILS